MERPIKYGNGKPASRPMRWRWYHYYFLLALFDLFVIAAALVLHHGALSSYQRALDKLSRIHEKQRWVTNVRLSLIKLNAPGNDVFQTRRIEEERARFAQAERDVRALLSEGGRRYDQLAEFRTHLDAMVQAERQVFDALSLVDSDASPEDAAEPSLEKAAAIMAVMDRKQAAALTALSEIGQDFSMREAMLLAEYGEQLALSAKLEKAFGCLVIVILVGVFWYGRKLQHMHEKMILEHQQLLVERHERLAAVGEVCTAVAHGIRNPLAAISTSAQLASRYGTLDDRSKARVLDILTECKRLDERVTRLINFANHTIVTAEPFDVVSAIEQAVGELKPELDDRRIRVETKLDPSPMRVNGTRDELVQCVIEILSNSLAFLPDGGNIRITCARQANRSDTVQIDLVDDGPGIPSHVRPQVFGLFFSTRSAGNGIGLAAVKRAVEMHGGYVSAEPVDGRGAHLRIHLPLIDESGNAFDE